MQLKLTEGVVKKRALYILAVFIALVALSFIAFRFIAPYAQKNEFYKTHIIGGFSVDTLKGLRRRRQMVFK